MMGILDKLFGSQKSTNKDNKTNEIANISSKEMKKEYDNGEILNLEITSDLKNKLKQDILTINKLVDDANKIINDSYPHLQIDKNFRILKYQQKLFTPSGKKAKCPYYILFDTTTGPGHIYYFEDMNIAGTRFTVWKNKEGITIETGKKDGILEVERITLNSVLNESKTRLYTKTPQKKKAPPKYNKPFIPTQRDIDDQKKASASYFNKVINEFYVGYNEFPFVSKGRELYTQWIDQAHLFPKQSLVKKEMMNRYDNGLLPGHIYLLYWLDKYPYGFRRPPVYFEYKYGICFEEELKNLKSLEYIGDDNIPTELGLEQIKKHHDIIEKHDKKSGI